jgi:4-hydroxy-3-methylbut-2-en-1-yl diphosphate reductase
MTASLVFRKGLDLKDAVAGELNQNYYSDLVQQIKAEDFQYRSGRLTIHLAREFGFCYGVDRAVDYAYQTRERFPDRRVFLTGEIIHNPHVNNRLRDKGIQFLSDADDARAPLGPDDVVVLPAFGVTTGEMQRFTDIGCVMVDTTCGSVLNVWKNVKRYAQDGFTSIIHGKVWHEETQATASQALTFPNGRFLVVLNIDETNFVCDYIRHGGDREAFVARFRDAMSPGFDPDRDLEHIGLANQTTMLMSETLRVQEMLRRAMLDRHGEDGLEQRFRAFDTICSATQERQDAVLEMLNGSELDLMIVIGGYNSSNTQALARMCAPRLTTYYIDSPDCISAAGIRHRPAGAHEETLAPMWLAAGDVRVGITAGASTPDSVVGEVIERILALRGRTAAELTQLAHVDQGSPALADSTARKQSFA